MAREIKNIGEFTCPLCSEPFTPDNPIAPKECADLHPYCSDCVMGHIQYQRSEYNDANIRCPAEGCEILLDATKYANKLAPKDFILWCDALCMASVTDPVQRYCPRGECSALIVDECGDTSSRPTSIWRRKGAVEKINCPDCKVPFCFKCAKPWHAGFSCKEAVEYMQDPNDQAFGVLVESEQWQRCPACHNYVERIEGCDLMKCRCGVRFCYKCGCEYARSGCECNENRTVRANLIVILFLAFSIGLMVAVYHFFRSHFDH